MRSPIVPLAVLLTVLLAGCSVDTASPARAAERFHTAVSARQDGAACAMLAPKTADRLPDPGQTCAQALGELKLGPAGSVTAVAVWGDDAQIRLAGDTVFLHRFDDGWRIRAASCKPVRDLPYDCDVDD